LKFNRWLNGNKHSNAVRMESTCFCAWNGAWCDYWSGD